MAAEMASQLEKLRAFYGAHPPPKTEKQLQRLLRQHSSWSELCAKLREKYGTDPEEHQQKAAIARGEEGAKTTTSPVPWETETTDTGGINEWQSLGGERNAPLPRATSIAIAKEGNLEKEKSENEWKMRYCELVVDDDEGARLVYRQKQGKRELGRAMLAGATLTHGSVGERASLLLIDAGGVEFKFGSMDHSVVSEWVNSLQAAMGVDDPDGTTGLGSAQQASTWPAQGQEKRPGPASVSSVASTAVSVLAGEIVQAGNLDKKKDQTWKQRYCELSIDDEEGARLVYRQKPGKRMMGIASLAGAVLSQSAVGERATFTLVDSSGVEYTFGSVDSDAVEQWATKIREAMGDSVPMDVAPGTLSPEPGPEPAPQRQLEPEPDSDPEPNPQQERRPQEQELGSSQQEVADDDFLLLEQQAVEEVESKGGVLSPPPPVSASRPVASKPPPLPAKTTRGPTVSKFMASLVGDDDSPRSPQLGSDAQPQVGSGGLSEGLPPVPAPAESSNLMASADLQAHVDVSSAHVEAMKLELAELRSSKVELMRVAREADERTEKLAESNAVLEQRAAEAATAVSSAESKHAAAIELATAPYVQEVDRLREDIGKLRRELLSRTAQHEEIRGKMTALAAARDAALANEQAAVESRAADRAASEQALEKAREDGESLAAQLREQLQEAKSRAAAADAVSAQAAEREEALSGEHSVVLEAISKQVEQLQVERRGLQETLRQAEKGNARLLGQMDGSEKENNKKIEELLHQVELWEAEANRLSADATAKEAIVTQMRAEAEQLYNELGALHQSADETQAELSSRARKAEAEVVRLRLQMSQIEDSAEDSVAGHEEESARHLAELRSEISRLLLAESEAKDLAQSHASRVAELESELAADQSSAAAAAASAAAATAELKEKLSAMESRAQNAEQISAGRQTEIGTLEEKVVSLSSQLVSSNKESAASNSALEQRLSMAQRDNGKFVLELSSLRGEIAELRSSATSMSTVHAEKDKQIGALSQDVLSLTRQLDEVRQELDSRDGTHADSAREQAEAFELRIVQLEAKVDEAQKETASALRRESEVTEHLESTKLELSAATARVVAAESALQEAQTQREASIDAEQKAKAELQERLDEIEEGTSEMEKLLEENEDLVAQNKAYRNRLRAMPTSAFGFENRTDPPSARFDPAVALLKHGANVKAGGRAREAASDRDRPLSAPGFGDTMAKAGALLQLVENPGGSNRKSGSR